MKKFFLLVLSMLCLCIVNAQKKLPRFNVIALYENGGHHIEYSKAARVWLDKLAADSNFSLTLELDPNGTAYDTVNVNVTLAIAGAPDWTVTANVNVPDDNTVEPGGVRLLPTALYLRPAAALGHRCPSCPAAPPTAET